MGNKRILRRTDNEIEVSGVKSTRKGLIPFAAKQADDVRIVVLQRGWVYVGNFTRNADNICRLTNASNIRVWGTSKGLPELVNGPTKNTILDKCDGAVEFDWLTVVHTITCNSAKWASLNHENCHKL